MSGARHSAYEVLDRSNGMRYRVDTDEHPSDLVQVLAKSGRYLVRPILVQDFEPPPASGDRERRIAAGSRRAPNRHGAA